MCVVSILASALSDPKLSTDSSGLTLIAYGYSPIPYLVTCKGILVVLADAYFPRDGFLVRSMGWSRLRMTWWEVRILLSFGSLKMVLFWEGLVKSLNEEGSFSPIFSSLSSMKQLSCKSLSSSP